MRMTVFSLVACAAVGVSASTVDAMPIGVASSSAGASIPVVTVAAGCGPGLVLGRRGTCVRRATVFSRSGRIIRPGCGKPIGAGLRTPC